VLSEFSTELSKCSSQHASKVGTGLRLANYGDISWRVQLPTRAFGVRSADLPFDRMGRPHRGAPVGIGGAAELIESHNG
jgi:hypothetical protein